MRHPSVAKMNLIAYDRFGPSATVHWDEQYRTRLWLGYRDSAGDVVWVAGSSIDDCLRRHDCGARGTGAIPS